MFQGFCTKQFFNDFHEGLQNFRLLEDTIPLHGKTNLQYFYIQTKTDGFVGVI